MEVSYNQTTEDYVSKIKKIWFLGGVNSGVFFLTQEAQRAQLVGLLFWWNMRSFAVELTTNLLLTVQADTFAWRQPSFPYACNTSIAG